MPNHWETSARPLFVKTVFVNGNRHAILSGEDPLLRCYPDKKISRSNSSISFESDFSISCSESQDSYYESKTKAKFFSQRQRKDSSSELQTCLVGLKLASGSLKYKNKSSQEKCLCNVKERKKTQGKEKGNSRQRKHNHEKISRRTKSEEIYDESKEYESVERETDQEKSCYVYNLENFKGKKKYCFVKISSQPPQFILNCCCEKNWKETHPPSKNNLVISATIHNLVMTTEEDENILHKTFDYVFPFQNAEIYCNNHLTKSCYNSLSDRVFQWLNLARKHKKQKEKSDFTNEKESLNADPERIYSGKTFMRDVLKTDVNKPESKFSKKPGKDSENTTCENVNEEVTEESQTLLSTDTPNHKQTPTKIESTKTLESITERQNFSTPVPPLKIQDLLLNYHPKNRQSSQNKKRIKETRNSTQRNRHKETDSSEEETWGKRTNKRAVFADKLDTIGKLCQNKFSDELGDPIKSPISREEFPERNQTSINNTNNTRARPVLIQNLLSPQQPDKMSYLQEEKIVWASEKNTGRPQLHIFMPSILLKDQSDDSMSECENFINL